MLLHICCRTILNNFNNLSVGDQDKLFKKQGNEDIAMITISIFLIIKIYITPTRFIENSAITVIYDVNKKLFERSKNIDKDDEREINQTLAVIDKKLSKEENP